jgi:hypothetical protein
MHYKGIEVLQKRARRKLISVPVALNLYSHNPDSPLRQSYANSRHCCEVLRQENNTLVSTFCGNRWCAVCGSIRTAKAINGYEPQLKTFQDPQFVTLTKQTVLGSDLPGSIAFMGESWRKIANLARGKRYGRIDFKGIRKAECTIRPSDRYHYHFHLIIEGKENAQWLISQWLRLMGDQATLDAQDMRQADKRSYVEIFKYATKLLCSSKDAERGFLPFDRMDVIFQALSGKRTFQPFGGVSMVSEEVDELTSETFDNLLDENQLWIWEQCDWLSEAGEPLTGYEPSPEFAKIFLSNLSH